MSLRLAAQARIEYRELVIEYSNIYSSTRGLTSNDGGGGQLLPGSANEPISREYFSGFSSVPDVRSRRLKATIS